MKSAPLMEVSLSALTARGFLLHRFSFDEVFQRAKISVDLSYLEKLSPSGTACYGVLVGNNKDLWPEFLQHCRNHPGWTQRQNPFDDYVESILGEVLSQHQHKQLNIIHSHKRYDGEFIPFQRLGRDSGFAYFDPVSHLSIHRTYGPWTAYRALIYGSDLEIKLDPANDCFTCPLDQTQMQEVEKELKQQHSDSNQEFWQRLVGVRDKIASFQTQWKSYRYSDDQIVFHYTHRLPTSL
jgi:methylmalonic aciduria homocystinuria type C protein